MKWHSNILKAVREFYKRNNLLSVLTLISLLIIILYQVTIDAPELWKNAGKYFELIYQLSLAIVANFIFFIFQIYLPRIQKESEMKQYISRRLSKISNEMNNQFESLSETYIKQTIGLADFTEKEFNIILNNFKSNDDSNIQLAFHCRQLTNLEMLSLSFENIDQLIIELQQGYCDYLYDDCKKLLKDISNCSFKELFTDRVILFEMFDTKGIQGNAALYSFKNYQTLYIRLLEYLK